MILITWFILTTDIITSNKKIDLKKIAIVKKSNKKNKK